MLKQFEKVYELVAAGQPEAAADVIYDLFDDALGDGRIEDVDQLLGHIDIERLSVFPLVGLLTITSAAREHLPARAALYEKIAARIRLELPDRVDRILVGLR